MSNIPEIFIDQTNGPILTFINSDGLTSSSLFMNSQNQLTVVSAGVILPFATSVSSSYIPAQALPAGTVSGSAQTLVNLQGSNINSGSAQTLVSLQSSNIFSSSAQLPAGILSSSAQLPSGIVSSSAQTLVNLQSSNINSSSAQTLVSLQGSSVVSSSLQFPTDAIFNVGIITASAIQVMFLNAVTVSSSVAYDSGSNIFGSVMANTHQFTGSVSMTGSLFVAGPINGTASWALNAVTAAFAQNFNPNATASYAIQAATASYISATTRNNANVGTGIVSSSAQTIAFLPAGTVSSSAQVLVGSTVWSSSAQLPAGTVSSSAQVLSGTGIYSSSAQLPSGLVSSSAQVIAALPAGTVSSSAQTVANLVGTQISPTGVTSSLFGTASWALNSVTSSYVTTAQTASYVLNAVSSSYALTASYVNAGNVTQAGYGELLKSGSKTVTSANTFEGILFDKSYQMSSQWTFTAGNSFASCSLGGLYRIGLTAFVQKTGGTANSAAIRILKNNLEISGSYRAYTYVSNNAGNDIISSVVESFSVGDSVTFQFAGGSTNIQLAVPPSVGSPVNLSSAVVNILRA